MGLSIPPKVNANTPELVVVGIELYKRDIRVIRRMKRVRRGDRRPVCLLDIDGQVITNQSLSGVVTEFSRKSRQNLAFVAQNTEIEFERMVTLTYPGVFPENGKACKKHLHVMLQWLRRRNVAAYLWFMEFQRRGAPHFHILLSGGDYIDRIELGNRWYEIVGSGDNRHRNSGTRIERGRRPGGLHRYAVKYASKLYQKSVPEGFSDIGRLWGCSRNVNPSPKKVVAVDSEESLRSILTKWEYSGEEANGYSVLFNATDAVESLMKELGVLGWGGGGEDGS